VQKCAACRAIKWGAQLLSIENYWAIKDFRHDNRRLDTCSFKSIFWYSLSIIDNEKSLSYKDNKLEIAIELNITVHIKFFNFILQIKYKLYISLIF
jgi:hypothetical protein